MIKPNNNCIETVHTENNKRDKLLYFNGSLNWYTFAFIAAK